MNGIVFTLILLGVAIIGTGLIMGMALWFTKEVNKLC